MYYLMFMVLTMTREYGIILINFVLSDLKNERKTYLILYLKVEVILKMDTGVQVKELLLKS